MFSERNQKLLFNINPTDILMDIKAIKFRKDGFYSQPFAFGGEEGPRCKQSKEKFNKA